MKVIEYGYYNSDGVHETKTIECHKFEVGDKFGKYLVDGGEVTLGPLTFIVERSK